MRMFRVRLSRMYQRTMSYIAAVRSTMVHTGRREAATKPTTIARM
jgi:hypothetical protein